MIRDGKLFIETMWIKMELGEEHWPEDLKLVSCGEDGMKWCTEDYYENWVTEEQANMIAKQIAIDLVILAGGTILSSNDGYSINLGNQTHRYLAPAASRAKNILRAKRLKEDHRPDEEPSKSPLEAAQEILDRASIECAEAGEKA